MRIKILIRLKNQILEPQGKVIEQSLKSLGFEEFSNIRQGKLIEIDLPDSLSEEERSGKIDAACKKLLANEIIEEYEVLG
jgi:phosphoribosylformylglycinamidine synthase PurS subunit